MKSFTLPFQTVALLVFFTHSASAQLSPAGMDDVGFTSLQSRLGAATPTGAGISASQVEAFESGTNYRPDAPQFSGHNFTYASGGSAAASGHATAVGAFFYGSGSLAPAVGTGAETITSYAADQWLLDNIHRGDPSLLPTIEVNDVQNHSWVGNSDITTSVDIVRRVDFAIQRDDFVAVFGLNNGRGTTVPSLLAGAYNGITVGLSNGDHSSGTSVVEGARTRPDLVVPAGATSYATPVVSSAAALIIETARGSAGLANAERSFVVKSLLMAGATRDEPEFGRPWIHSSTQPLDVTYGAGELNIDNSHQILTAGETAASVTTTQGATGWDLGVTSVSGSNLYFFEITGDSQVSAALVWNRMITATDTNPGAGFSYQFGSTLAGLDLHLFNAAAFALGSEIDSSLSAVDNVELVTTRLAAGRYAWQVTSDTALTEYGISWQAVALAVPEPSISCLLLAAVSLTTLRRRRL